MATLRTRHVWYCTGIILHTDPRCQVGTYNAAVLASRHNIPFIVVAPISTVDLDIADGSAYVCSSLRDNFMLMNTQDSH